MSDIDYLKISDNSKLWSIIVVVFACAAIAGTIGKNKDEDKPPQILSDEDAFGFIGVLVGAFL